MRSLRLAVAFAVLVVLALPMGITGAPVPRAGGTLDLALNNAGTGAIDPSRMRHTKTFVYQRHICDPLVQIDPKNGEPVPALATSWETSGGGRILTFRLRRGVKFHDGTAFDANAVKVNFDRVAETKRGAGYSALGGPRYLQTRVVDPQTVQIVLSSPYPAFLEETSWRIGMHSPLAMERAGSDYGGKVVVCTGPFRHVEFVPENRAVMVRSADYTWGSPLFKHQGPAYLERLIIRGIQDPGTRRAAFESKEIALFMASERDVEDFRGRSGVRVEFEIKAGINPQLFMNMKRAPLDDLRVRQAISHAVNRDLLLRSQRYAGIGKVAYGLVSEKNWGGSNDEFRRFNFLFDQQRAKTLLDEAGWRVGTDGVRTKEGKRLTFEMVNPSLFRIEMEVIQAMLKEVGIEVKITQPSVDAWFNALDEGLFDLTIDSFSGWGLGLLADVYHGKASASTNRSRYSDPDTDRLLSQLEVEADVQKRKEAGRLATQRVLRAAAVVPLIQENYVFVMYDEVRDVFYPDASWPSFYDTWLMR